MVINGYPKRMLKKKQTGIALLVVLLVVATVAAIAVDITSRNQISVRRTLNLAGYDQAYWYALSAEEFAEKVLKQDLKDSQGRVHLQQAWAQSNVVYPVENGKIAGEISDMRACFNLNALSAETSNNGNNGSSGSKSSGSNSGSGNRPSNPPRGAGQPKTPLALEQFAALLVNLGMEPFNAERLAFSLRDYIYTGKGNSGFGLGDAAYESRDVPYRAAKTLMNHRSELRAVLGFTQDVYLKLAPYVCAIPGNNQQIINVNTIKTEQAPILAAMLKNKISVGEATSVINQRPGDGFEKVEDFWALPEVSNAKGGLVQSSFAVTSEYFMLDATTQFDDAIFQLESVLKVNRDHNADVITRQYGGQK
ncbi:MAG: type II secretion system minor pseudopilin GspK [Parashewanella sp.]